VVAVGGHTRYFSASPASPASLPSQT